MQFVLPTHVGLTRHENGGGLIGMGAVVGDEVYVEEGSLVLGGHLAGKKVRVTGCSMVTACVIDVDSQVEIAGSRIAGLTVTNATTTKIAKSELVAVTAQGHFTATNATLTNVTFKGRCEFTDASVTGCDLTEVKVADANVVGSKRYESDKLPTIERCEIIGASTAFMGVDSGTKGTITITASMTAAPVPLPEAVGRPSTA